jgi:hypothetical protein
VPGAVPPRALTTQITQKGTPTVVFDASRVGTRPNRSKFVSEAGSSEGQTEKNASMLLAYYEDGQRAFATMAALAAVKLRPTAVPQTDPSTSHSLAQAPPDDFKANILSSVSG